MSSIVTRRIIIILCIFLYACTLQAQTRSPESNLDTLLHRLNDVSSKGEDSMQMYTEAFRLASELNDYNALVEVYRLKGRSQFLTGNHSEAVKTLIEGVKAGERHHVKHHYLVIAYYELGTVYSKNKNLELARLYMNKGMELAIEIRDTSAVADGNNRIGILCENRSDLDSAFYFYQRSYELNIAVKDSLGTSYSLENMAGILSRQKKFTQAIAYLREAIVIREAKNDLYGQAIATINMSELFHDAQQPDSAVKYALAAEEAGRKVKFLDLLQYNYQHLCNIYKKKSDYKTALFYHEKYAALNDSVYNDNKAKQIAELSTKFETEKKEEEIKILNKQKTIQKLGLLSVLLLLAMTILLTINIIRNRKRKEEQLKKEAAFQLQLKEVESRNAMQQERLRISRELHDNIGAHLTFINATVENMAEQDEKIKQVRELTNDTIKELRKTVWLINKEQVSIEEFIVKLRDFLKNVPQIQLETHIYEPEQKLRSEVVTEVFRSIQESVNNALKYAQAEKIHILICTENNHIQVEVSDDGQGFDAGELQQKGFGLDNMRHRMASVGGNYHIVSRKGEGTRVYVSALIT